MELKIKEEFKELIPPLSIEEYKQLENNCIEDGIREPILTWNGFIIDGHNRFKIAEQWGLEFDSKSMFFQNEGQVKEWMILNQFGRRNLSNYQRSLLALKLEDVFKEKAKENLSLSGGDRKSENKISGSQISAKAVIDTRQELAKVANVSHDTIAKVKKIEEKASPEIKEQLQKQEISINKAYTELNKAHVSNNSGNNEWYTPIKFIDSARLVMGSIDLDPASSLIANKTINATTFYSKEINGLDKEWSGNIWMNPPYAQPLINDFCEKITSENINQGIVLVNNATETKWGNLLLSNCSSVCFVSSRIRFVSPDGKLGDSPLQGQMILYFGKKEIDFINEFKKYGVCLKGEK